MGFAHVLRHTGCDQHLVHLLVQPLTKVRFLLIPGTVLVGFFVNMPIVSQTSTAVTIGFVVIPILRAANISPVTTGAALLLGASIGGELLNPGAPELLTTIHESQKAARENPELGHEPSEYNSERCVRRIIPLDFLGLAVGTLVFWWLAHRYEKRLPPLVEPANAGTVSEPFQVNWLMAAVPLLPLIFLYLCSYPFRWIQLDQAWLELPTGTLSDRFETRMIGFAMLLGVVAAALVSARKLNGVGSAFFEGAGYGYAHIVSLIVAANCFGSAIRGVGIAESIGSLIAYWPDLLIPGAGILPLAFALLCGSGMASTQSLFGFFAEPALRLGIDPTHVGAVVSIASAAGRTMSPVAAVTLMCAKMAGVKPWELSKQVALPLLISIAIIIVIAMIIVPAS